VTGLRFGTILLVGALLLPAQDFRESIRKVSAFALPNGMRFILMERRQAPVVSFYTLVNAGSAQDPAGQTGMAAMIEHLSFKGTESIGTKGWAAEKKAMDDVEEAYDRLAAERNRGLRADQGRLASLEIDLKRAMDLATSTSDPNEFARAIQENGGVGLASRTTPDLIETSYSLPSNRIELWFLMESQRLKQPAFRDFYRAREALQAENRNNVESRALPKLQQALLATAFAAHPYRNPVLGWPSDVANLRRADAKAFFDTYCVPGNIVMGIVGDLDPANAQRLAERYFGSLPAKPLPPVVHTEEPPQLGPKTVVVGGSGQQILLMGYKRPNQTHRDDVAFDVIAMILGEGRASWMYKELVEEKRIAQTAGAASTYPSGRYTNLCVFSVAPARDHTLEENQKAMEELLARFESRPVEAGTLERVKNIVRGRITRIMGNNRDLASLLPNYYVQYGDWHKLFTETSAVTSLTADDLQRVAAQYFTPANRTVAYLTDGALPNTVPSATRGAQ
jgi:predicted Zn-dependent peptidase